MSREALSTYRMQHTASSASKISFTEDLYCNQMVAVRRAQLVNDLRCLTGSTDASNADTYGDQLRDLLELHAVLGSLAHNGKSGKTRKAPDGASQVLIHMTDLQPGSACLTYPTWHGLRYLVQYYNSKHCGPSWVQLVDNVSRNNVEFTWSLKARDLTNPFDDGRVQYRSVAVLPQLQTALKSALQALYPAQPKDSCVLTSDDLCWVRPACVSCCMQ